ncbi:hypothetical protein AVEN_154311-1, partial [Araneus ventricosus]
GRERLYEMPLKNSISQEPFFLDEWLSSTTHSTLKGTRRKDVRTTSQGKYSRRSERGHHGKPDGL